MIMKKGFDENFNNPASALLLSFFMMTLLILASLSISFLVIRDVSTVRTIVSGVQSEYAAEALSEMGLYGVAENLPGYEPSMDEYTFASSSLASLSSDARGAKTPCFGEEDDWLVLGENESMQLALFAQLGDEIADSDYSSDEVDDMYDFYVEFYVGDEDGDVNFPANDDVLRWKVLGVDGSQTEAISQYIPLVGWSDSENPSIFGPGVENATLSEYTEGKFYKDEGSEYVFYESYPIKTFLEEHKYNYLILTNVIQSGIDEYIYFRLVSDSPEGVCEYVELASVGSTEFGATQQTLDTYVREGENLPVFDFVLYHTDNDGSEEEEGEEGSSGSSGSGSRSSIDFGEFTKFDFGATPFSEIFKP